MILHEIFEKHSLLEKKLLTDTVRFLIIKTEMHRLETKLIQGHFHSEFIREHRAIRQDDIPAVRIPR